MTYEYQADLDLALQLAGMSLSASRSKYSRGAL
jgi:hypothetical protein